MNPVPPITNILLLRIIFACPFQKHVGISKVDPLPSAIGGPINSKFGMKIKFNTKFKEAPVNAVKIILYLRVNIKCFDKIVPINTEKIKGYILITYNDTSCSPNKACSKKLDKSNIEYK